MRWFIIPCLSPRPQHAGFVLYSSAADFRGTELCSLFAAAKYAVCSPTQRNEEARQVTRFSELSFIKAIYVFIVLPDYKNWEGEERTVNCTVYFMEWKTQHNCCSEVRLAHKHVTAWSRVPQSLKWVKIPQKDFPLSSAWFTKSDGEWRNVDWLQWLTIPWLQTLHHLTALSLLHSQVPKSLGVRVLLC